MIRILAVDDESNVLSSLRRLFFELDFDFVDAGSAAEGLETIQNGSGYDVVISDYQMPGMNGISFLSAAREQQPKALRILLTAQVPSLEIAAAIEFGTVNIHLSKPWDNDELLAVIERWCSLNRLRHHP